MLEERYVTPSYPITVAYGACAVHPSPNQEF